MVSKKGVVHKVGLSANPNFTGNSSELFCRNAVSKKNQKIHRNTPLLESPFK